MALLVLIAIGLFVIPTVMNHLRLRALERSAEAFFSEALTKKRLLQLNVHAMLKRGEEGYYQEQASLHEPRAVRHYGSIGTSVRLMRGISVRSSQGQSFSEQEWRKLDEGKLIVTNSRIIFDGATEHRSLDLGKLDCATMFADGIRISMCNRQKPLTFVVPNPWIVVGILGILRDPTKFFGAQAGSGRQLADP